MFETQFISVELKIQMHKENFWEKNWGYIYLAPKISFFANDCPDIILIRSWLVPSSLCWIDRISFDFSDWKKIIINLSIFYALRFHSFQQMNWNALTEHANRLFFLISRKRVEKNWRNLVTLRLQQHDWILECVGFMSSFWAHSSRKKLCINALKVWIVWSQLIGADRLLIVDPLKLPGGCHALRAKVSNQNAHDQQFSLY